MKYKIPISILIFVLTFIVSPEIYSLGSYQGTDELADSLIKRQFGSNYVAGATIDIDTIMATPWERSRWEGYIYEDSLKQLEHCIVSCFGYWSNGALSDYGGIAIIKDNKIIWHSKMLINSFSSVASRISGVADLNKDGITDIIVSIYSGDHAQMESLWIITPNTQGGYLLNSIDKYNNSTIVGAFQSFNVRSSKDGKSKVLSAHDVFSGNKIHYILNGRFYKKIE